MKIKRYISVLLTMLLISFSGHLFSMDGHPKVSDFRVLSKCGKYEIRICYQGAGKLVKVCDLERKLDTFTYNFEGEIVCADVSPCGKFIAVVDKNGCLHHYDLTEGAQKPKVTKTDGYLDAKSVFFSKEGDDFKPVVISASEIQKGVLSISLSNVHNKQQILACDLSGPIIRFNVSSNGNFVFLANTKKYCVYNISDKEKPKARFFELCVDTKLLFFDYFTDDECLVTDDGCLVAADGSLVFATIPEYRDFYLNRLKLEEKLFKNMRASFDFPIMSTCGKYTITLHDSGAPLIVWDVKSDESAIFSYPNDNLKHGCACFSQSGNFVVSGGDKGGYVTVYADIFDKKKRKKIPAVNCGSGKINTVCFSPDEKCIAVGGAYGDVRVFEIVDVVTELKDARLEKMEKKLEERLRDKHDKNSENIFTCSSFSPNGNLLVFGTVHGELVIYDTSNKFQIEVKKKRVVKFLGSVIKTLCFSRCGNFFAIAIEDKSLDYLSKQHVEVFDVRNVFSEGAKQVCVIENLKDVRSLHFGPTAAHLGMILRSRDLYKQRISENDKIKVWYLGSKCSGPREIYCWNSLYMYGLNQSTICWWIMVQLCFDLDKWVFRTLIRTDKEINILEFAPSWEFEQGEKIFSEMSKWDNEKTKRAMKNAFCDMRIMCTVCDQELYAMNKLQKEQKR